MIGTHSEPAWCLLWYYIKRNILGILLSVVPLPLSYLYVCVCVRVFYFNTVSSPPHVYVILFPSIVVISKLCYVCYC